MLRSIVWNGLGVLRAEHEKAPRIRRIVFVALGLLLLVTALLKAQGLSDGALGQNTLLLSPRLRFLVMEVEALLGLLLLSGRAKRAAWFLTVAFFLVTAGASLALGLAGESSCDCFGRIHVSPWNAFALDVACLATLGLCRPSFRTADWGQIEQASFWLREVLKIAAGAGLLLALVGGAFLWLYDDPVGALALLRGESITIEPSVSEVGDGVVGEQRTITIQLRNHSNRSIRIIGGTTTRWCNTADDLPIIVPPKVSRSIAVRIKFRGSPGRFRHSFVLYTDEEKQATMTPQFAGRVIELSSP